MLYGGVLRNQAPVKRSGVIYRSDDLGETWKKMTEYKHTGGSGLVNQTEAGYYARLYVDAQNDQTLYACDTNTTVSTDGGKTFKATGWDSGAYKLHVDHRALWLDPQNSNHIMSGNDGGAGETWDGGKHWSQKSTISAQQFYDVSADNEMPYNVMGGTQDNGAWIGPSQNRNAWGVFAADWRYLPTGDGFFVVRDWWNPDYIYYESQFGALEPAEPVDRRELVPGQADDARGAGQGRCPPSATSGTPRSCSRPTTRASSTSAPSSSTAPSAAASRDTFVTISPDLTRADKTRLEEAKKTNLQYATIYTFAESPKKPGLYWAGTDDGNVQMSPDGGVTWTNITANFYDMKTGKAKPGVKGALIPFDRWVKRVVPSRFDENTCYVAFSGYRTHNEDKTWLFVTRDLGKTWEDISGGHDEPALRRRRGPGQRQRPLHRRRLRHPGLDRQGQDLDDLLDLGAERHRPRPGRPEARPRPRHRHLRPGHLHRRHRPAQGAEAPRTWPRTPISSIPKRSCAGTATAQSGEQYGEFAKVDNPALGSTLYYYLKGEPKAVKIVIKDLEGTLIQELTGAAKKGLQKASWNLTKRVDPAQQAAGRPRRRHARPGRPTSSTTAFYNVTLNVDGKDIATKKIKVSPDPLFK